MKTPILLSFTILFIPNIFSQNLVSHNRYIIYLSDKNNNSFTVQNPQQYLSARAIQRRTNQNLAYNISDLPITQSYINDIANTGAKILKKSKWQNFVCVQIADSTQLTAIMQLPFVVTNKLVNRVATLSSIQNKIDKFQIENTVFPTSKIAKNNITNVIEVDTSISYGASFNQANQIAVDALHNIGYMGQGIQVAVFDAGFPNVDTLSTFDSLRMNNRLLGHYNFISDTIDVFNSSYNSHGTNTLSCMVAWTQGQLVGTAPRASYYLFITEYAPSETPYEEVCWLAAAEYADSLGVDVISSSLGYTTFDYAASNYTNADMDGNTTICTKAADMAASKGILVINSAGNSGAGSWQIIGAPADGDSVLSIGAVNENGVRASFSSKGYTADGRIKPDVCAQGANTVIAKHTGGFQTGNGTSFSGPVLAGAAACLWQAFPNKTNMEIQGAIKQSASQYNSPDSLLGYGIPNFSNALFLITKTKFNAVGDTKIDNIFPIPFTNELSIIYHSLDTEKISLTLCDVYGNTVVSEQFMATTNSQNIFTCTGLETIAKGIYIVTIVGKNKRFSQRVVK